MLIRETVQLPDSGCQLLYERRTLHERLRHQRIAMAALVWYTCGVTKSLKTTKSIAGVRLPEKYHYFFWGGGTKWNRDFEQTGCQRVSTCIFVVVRNHGEEIICFREIERYAVFRGENCYRLWWRWVIPCLNRGQIDKKRFYRVIFVGRQYRQ